MPCIPLLLICFGFLRFGSIVRRATHYALNVTFHALFVESIEFEASLGWGSSGAGTRNAFYGIEGMCEDSIYGYNEIRMYDRNGAYLGRLAY